MQYSVIIPVYNAERTLRRCLDSLVGQQFSDYELLLINDGSTDGSDAICREYANTYSCVRYFAKEILFATPLSVSSQNTPVSHSVDAPPKLRYPNIKRSTALLSSV